MISRELEVGQEWLKPDTGSRIEHDTNHRLFMRCEEYALEGVIYEDFYDKFLTMQDEYGEENVILRPYLDGDGKTQLGVFVRDREL